MSDGHRIQPTIATSAIAARNAIAEFRQVQTLADLVTVKNRFKPRLLPGRDTTAVRNAYEARQRELRQQCQSESSDSPVSST